LGARVHLGPLRLLVDYLKPGCAPRASDRLRHFPAP
jgi:hypothetical protein